MQHRELRFKTAEFRTEKGKDGSMIVSGYVNSTGEFSDPLRINRHESFIETIAPGAFSRAIERAASENKDIDFLAEHDPTKILSSTRNNSLTLVEDSKGLYMSSRIADTSWGNDFYKLISEGIIRNLSFGFVVDEENDDWEFNESGNHKRVIRELDLFEVSAVRHPAYPQSYVEARGLTPSNEMIEIRRGDNKMDKELETREEEVSQEEDREESEVADVTGSIISIDQRLETMESKLDEVLDIVLSRGEEEEEVEEEELTEEKKEEEEAKKKEAIEEDEEDELRTAIDNLIEEFDIKTEEE